MTSTSSPKPAAERSARHRAHLAALGIECWQRRAPRANAPTPAAEAAAASAGPVTLQLAEAPVASALVDWPGTFTLDSEAGQLLTKILAATGHAPERFTIIQATETPAQTDGPILWFTRRTVEAAVNVTLLPALQTMLEQPALKRVAWSELKRWMAQHGGGR
jgi:hypothetical protein